MQEKVRRLKTFSVGDWVTWALLFALSVIIDTIDIIFRVGMTLVTWGLNLAVPDPVNFTLNMIMIGLAKVFWGTGSALFQMGETVLEFVPVVGKAIDMTPVLSVSGIFYLLDMVDPSEEKPHSERTRGEWIQLGTTFGAALILFLIIWQCDIAGWVTSSILGAVTFALVTFAFQIDWYRVNRPKNRTIMVVGSIVAGLALLPCLYSLTVSPESLRPAAWEKVSDDFSEYFPGAEERVKEWSETAADVRDAVTNPIKEKSRSITRDIIGFLTDRDISRQEGDSLDPEVARVNAEIKALRSKGIDVRSATDFERYNGLVTYRVAEEIKWHRVLGWFLISLLVMAVTLFVRFWPQIARIPIKPAKRPVLQPVDGPSQLPPPRQQLHD